MVIDLVINEKWLFRTMAESSCSYNSVFYFCDSTKVKGSGSQAAICCEFVVLSLGVRLLQLIHEPFLLNVEHLYRLLHWIVFWFSALLV